MSFQGRSVVVVGAGSAVGEAVALAFTRLGASVLDADVDTAIERFGALDVLVNVTALSPNCPVEELTEKQWDDVFAVELKGPLFACQAAVPHMKERGGAIVNVVSGAAFSPVAGLAASGAAQAGLVALGRVVAIEAGPQVRVNTVVVEPTTEPAEIADVIVWVASDAALAVNGALLRVDGGHSML
jgi:pteridine reductase